MRWLRSYGEVDCGNSISFDTVKAEIDNVTGVSALHSLRRKRLVLLLIESRIRYEMLLRSQKTASPGASAREIEKILGSLHRIAEFAKRAGNSPSAHDAASRMVYVENEMLPGYPETSGRSRVHDFFDMAGDVYNVAKIAHHVMSTHEREESSLSAIEWLVGSRLPGLYGSIFGTRFTTTRGNNPGIEFVQQALKAIKVRQACEDETIISHYKAAQRAEG